MRSELIARRQRYLDQIRSAGGGVAVLPAAHVFIRNNDVEHEYRQDSDFYYLTGFDEPESVLVLSTEHPEHRAVLFLRRRDKDRETWDGPRLGVERAPDALGIDAAFPIDELDKRLPDYLADVTDLHYRLGANPEFDKVILRAIEGVRRRARTGVIAPSKIIDIARDVHEMRLHKTEAELDAMAKACEITRKAHLQAMHVAQPGRYEYEVEAEILRVYRAHGAERPAYGSIVGSGPNATILHYRKNDRQMQAGDLLLIDAGAEHGYYASDVTRTFPVSGRFTPAQRAIYDLVLASQLAAIETVKPGVPYLRPHERAVEVLTQGLIDLGIIRGPLPEAIEEGRYRPFYMHRTSHWLGMDVHDVGDYFSERKPRVLAPGMVLTIEPGLYFAVDADVDPKWRGIGVRIEDDIAVTDTGYRNLTVDIPKAAADLERLLGARPQAA
jgi:Xaa-Pro aminopeptidase